MDQMQRIIAERDRLRSIIERAAGTLGTFDERVDHRQLMFDLGRLGGSSVEAFDVTWRAALAINSITLARSILDEASPDNAGNDR
jgi:hypothetical protein